MYFPANVASCPTPGRVHHRPVQDDRDAGGDGC